MEHQTHGNFVVSYLTSFQLAALIKDEVLCVHGGLSPEIPTIDSIHVVERQMELPNQGKLCDLMWSDPSEQVTDWQLNERGAGYLFGNHAVNLFNHTNGVNLICRAHQLAMEGFQYHFPQKTVMTIWSAPNYCYRCGNKATVLELDEKLERTLTYFTEVSSKYNITADSIKSGSLYFL